MKIEDLYAGITLSQNLHQMDTLWRKRSNSTLIIKNRDVREGISHGMTAGWVCQAPGATWWAGGKIFGMSKNCRIILRLGLFSCLICVSISGLCDAWVSRCAVIVLKTPVKSLYRVSFDHFQQLFSIGMVDIKCMWIINVPFIII